MIAAGQRNGYRIPFLAVGSAAATLACVLVLFIFNPSIPSRLHALVTGRSESTMITPLASAEQVVPEQVGFDGRDPILQNLLMQNDATEERDRAFIADLYKQEYPTGAIQVRSIDEEKVYAVRRYELSGGKRVVIYTEIKDGKRERSSLQEPLITY
jgi:hypothetical protein